MNKIINDIELANFFRVTPRHIRKMAQDYGMPKEGSNQYDFVKCCDWRIKTLESELNESKHGTETEKKARIRFLIAKAMHEELSIAEKQKEIMPVSEFSSLIEKAFIAVKQKLLSIPKRLSPNLQSLSTTIEIEDYLEKEVYKILIELKNVSNRK